MIRIFLDVYVLILITDVILSYFPGLAFSPWVKTIKKLADLTCVPIRRIMPSNLPMDFSPMIVILGIQLIKMLW